ncbi:MAG TPA: flagellar motor switch protein FliM [Methylomirabilota bacterium]|nr:flagellar motor switch protein FliM [Methylomirabilota bacterium]
MNGTDLIDSGSITAFPGAAVAPDTRPREARPARRLDFRNKVAFSERHQRMLRQEHDDFANSLAALLSIFLRTEFGLQVTSMETAPFEQFASSLTQASHLVLFKTDTAAPTSIFEISPRLALSFVDRLLGGPGKAQDAARELTSIEVSLLEQVVQLFINEWCNHWAKDRFKPTIVGHETNPLFLRTSSPETTTFILHLEVTFGECVEQVHLAFPYPAVESAVGEAAPPAAPSSTGAQRGSTIAWRPELDSIEVPLSAEWQINNCPAREVAALNVGDVLYLEEATVEEVIVRVSALEKFSGRLGIQNNRRAVQITSLQQAA